MSARPHRVPAVKLDRAPGPINPEAVVATVCDRLWVDVLDLFGDARCADTPDAAMPARAAIAIILRDYGTMSVAQTAAFLGLPANSLYESLRPDYAESLDSKCRPHAQTLAEVVEIVVADRRVYDPAYRL